jgi:hypothetical protein
MVATLVHNQAAGLDMEGREMNIKDADIVRIARDAGINICCDGIWCNVDQLQRFAELVAAHEREECAQVCEDAKQEYNGIGHERELKYTCADAIRARSKA